jgi:hypothetical protein
MEHRRTASSYGLLRDSRRKSWILVFPTEECRLFLPVDEPERDCRIASPPLVARPRTRSAFAPLVVLVLSVVTATLLHALR